MARNAIPVEESPGSMETGWRLTAAGGDPRESATENKPPRLGFGLRAVRVKRCGKSAPRVLVTRAARQTPPGARPNRGGRERGNPARKPVFRPAARVGCSRRLAIGVPDEWPSRGNPDRTRLIGRLTFPFSFRHLIMAKVGSAADGAPGGPGAVQGTVRTATASARSRFVITRRLR